MKLCHKFHEQVFLEYAILPGNNDVHITTGRLTPSVGTAHLRFVSLRIRSHSCQSLFYFSEHFLYFFSRDSFLKILIVLKSYFLVSGQ